MKWLAYILLIFCFGSSSGQNLYTNEPDLVYPILEEFIAENFKNDTPSFAKINQIDSIVVEDLGYDISGPFMKKVFGRQIPVGRFNSIIKIDSILLADPLRFERTLKHELGHVFGLPHLGKDNYLEFMCETHYEEVKQLYADPDVWTRMNTNYYNSIKLLYTR